MRHRNLALYAFLGLAQVCLSTPLQSLWAERVKWTRVSPGNIAISLLSPAPFIETNMDPVEGFSSYRQFKANSNPYFLMVQEMVFAPTSQFNGLTEENAKTLFAPFKKSLDDVEFEKIEPAKVNGQPGYRSTTRGTRKDFLFMSKALLFSRGK